MDITNDVLVTSRSKNEKIGDIPQVTFMPEGTGKAALEAHVEGENPWPAAYEGIRESCEGCPLLTGSPRCYSHNGRGRMAMASIVKAAVKNPARYSLGQAMVNRRAGAKAVRFSPIGDSARALRETVEAAAEKVRQAGLSVISYTHFPDEVPWMKTIAMASVQSITEAEDLLGQGWRVALVAEDETGDLSLRGKMEDLGGQTQVPFVVCPAMVQKRKQREWKEDPRGVGPRSVTCDDCRLCDASKPGPVIVFPDHGVTAGVGPWRG